MKFWKRIHDENLVDEMSSRGCRPQVTVMDMASTALSEIGAKLELILPLLSNKDLQFKS